MKVVSILLCLLLLSGCASTAAIEAALTKEEATAIALEHAGLTEEQVGMLRTHYEIDDGVPQYDVDFRMGLTEYEYTVHAETGAILSFEMGD